MRLINTSHFLKMTGIFSVYQSMQEKLPVAGFLDWMVNKRKGKSEFVNRLDEAVQKTRNHEEWRMECMTLLMRDNKMREEFIIRMEKAGYRVPEVG